MFFYEIRNFDQTWRAFYHVQKHATRHTDRTFNNMMQTNGQKVGVRLRKKTPLFASKKVTKSIKKKKSSAAKSEDYRLDPIANVPGR